MQEHFHFTTNKAKIQKQYAAILSIVITQLSYIEPHLKRRNRHLLKQTDAVIIAIHVLGKLFGFTSERAWHRFIVGNLFTKYSLNVLDTTVDVVRCVGRSNGFDTNSLKVDNITPMPSWTVYRSSYVTMRVFRVSNVFGMWRISDIVLLRKCSFMDLSYTSRSPNDRFRWDMWSRLLRITIESWQKKS